MHVFSSPFFFRSMHHSLLASHFLLSSGPQVDSSMLPLTRATHFGVLTHWVPGEGAPKAPVSLVRLACESAGPGVPVNPDDVQRLSCMRVFGSALAMC